MNSYNYAGIEVSVNASGNNRPMRMHLHEGRHYIESREGTEYLIEVTNRNWFRVEVVASVDGLGVINGKPASKNDSGYIIPAYGSFRIKGYRKDDSEVGAFKFTTKNGSYAASKNGADNVGLIAIAVYKEKLPIYMTPVYTTPAHTTWPPDNSAMPLLRCMSFNTSSEQPRGISTSDAVCSSMASWSQSAYSSVIENQPVQHHGTTWGSVIRDAVVTTEFEREYLMLEKEIFYDSRDSLLSRGVKLSEEKLMVKPRGFPSDFATPPPTWRG